ncbi:MAG: glutamyl-tRNA(Gln) and/or aspartyl-tRNA(Asn) amidotransferase subunit A, aspartyl-tRNA(Asn)/glutamyl-tRNA (Gln) amidotransferase subunit A [Candidatus Gottesmanbacteria bacterium GW2011_GWA2_43_14]|uniref:Glutamyl-tRNA(Gln) amidotransferase subunit A n=1 Tax=Candidatus Gottesmanbacteria bacterium GW2011_GWA2_43_14 TaxID=1618443 RepID=A0A0G1GIA3_9BACT|nr:MAG: glutamyl-tRNA(Gln) and/or aspartyl-tRNA(Asn) amidotransferase subunit A, aspartyl-tRNA(Asn)/glutamyl-tRNA (Gln) amidotransferase subunit A [Candidatus Gottesmanbacteria bacterium GW2011_GWA2_43_14]
MITDKTIKEIHSGLKRRDYSCVEIIEETYKNIEKYDSEINSAITVLDKKSVLKKAKAIDAEHKVSDLLCGIPFVLKDAYVTRGIRTTCASNVLADYIPQYNATVYKKLNDLGAVLIGKMNQDAWGHGGSTENTDFAPTHNPWDLTRVAGGSSGGPAAALAGRMSVFAIGEDTGGSIRNPAAWCNITGLKVSYGRVSRYGSIAYASSFDTVGPMGKTAEDCAIILERIAGKDPYDATSSLNPVPTYTASLDKTLKGKKIALPKDLLGKGLDPEIKNAILEAAEKFNFLGVAVEEVSMPIFDYGLAVYYVIAPCETSSNLARYDGIRYGNDRSNFTEETMRRIMIGTYALSAGYYDAFYRKAQKARTLFIKAYQDILSKFDAILMPVNPTPPTVIGELIGDPLQNLLADFYTVTQNPVGVPSLAVPCGFTKNKLPIGMQLIGKMFTEEILLNIGHQYQLVTDWHKKKPEMIS